MIHKGKFIKDIAALKAGETSIIKTSKFMPEPYNIPTVIPTSDNVVPRSGCLNINNAGIIKCPKTGISPFIV